MTAVLRRVLPVLGLVLLMALPAFAQADQPADQPAGGQSSDQPAGQPAGGFKFNMGLGIGVQTFNDAPPPTSGVTYQSLSLVPDISFGKLGVGLDLTFNYNFSGPNNSLHVRQEDWWPTNGVTFQHVLGIYLPKIAYVRWGEKEDREAGNETTPDHRLARPKTL